VREHKPIVKRNSEQFGAMCEALLERGVNVRFLAQGQSMQPNVLNNDAVIVAPAEQNLRRGDVALTRSEDGFCVHRVCFSDGFAGEIVTRGDAGQENDRAANLIFGKVIAIERNGQKASIARPGIKFLHAARTWMRRLRLAFALRLGQLSASSLCFGLIAALGLLLNASPVAAQADLTMSQTTSVSVVATGVNFAYTEIATNNGPNAVPTGTLVVYQQTPASTTFQSISVDANWKCTTPTAGNSGPIICTYQLALANGATTAADPIVITESVTAGTAADTTILNSATVTSQTADPVPSNNTTVTTVLVEPVADADLALFMTASPTPAFLSSSLTYTIQVQNLGQASAATVQVADTIPTGTTLVSATGSTGWSCSGTTAITCSLTGTMAQGAVGTINIAVTTPASSGPISNTATVSSSTTDPISGNNSATVVTVVQPLVCATPGNDGTGGTLTGIVNTYYPPSANGTLAAGATTVSLGVSTGAAKAIGVGDLLLIMQMQDALINSTNTGAYGDGSPGDPATGSTNFQSTGLFEYVTAASAVPVGGGTLTFQGTGAAGGLLNSYAKAAYTAGTNGQQTYQVIRVPQYTSATLSSGLVPLAWNGSVGGVLALDVSSQLTLGGTVAADSLGFRGGGGRILTGGAGADTDYRTLSTVNTNGAKGEGVGGTPAYVAPATITTTTAATNTGVEGLPNGSSARGAPGNAGGGGTDGDPTANDYNSGGGAGGNGGAGGPGGYGWNTYTKLNTTDGGFGGSAFPATTSAIVMGGGGGAGSTNNGSYYISATNNNSNSLQASCSTGTTPTCTGIYSSGGVGGGIVIVHTGSVAGTGTITSNGGPTLSTLNDSTGGGGAGGTIIFFANNGAVSGLTVSANGGNAGNAWPNEAPGTFSGNRHGPGGGGGGGVILLSGTPASVSVSGGANGDTDTVQDSYGATPGHAGITATNLVITETPGAQPGAYCASADLAVTNTGTPNPVLPGANITYTQVVTNNGPLDPVNAVFTEAIPSNTTFQSLVIPPGWTCTTPAVNGTGNISCANPDVSKSSSATFTLAVQVLASTAWGTQIVDVAGVSSGTSDPNLANNSAMVTTAVSLSNMADDAITNTASAPTSAPTVVAGNNITYTQVVTNNGPAASPSTTVTENLPSNTTFVSASGPTGWTCSYITTTTPNTITCSSSTALASGANATITVVVTAAAGTAAGTVISDVVSVSSAIEDPNTTNNTATANVTVATTGQADLAVTSSASPNPITDGNNITYTQSVINNGPAASGTATFTDTIPTNTTFVSFTVPSGWNCGTSVPAVGGTGTISCSIASLAVSATASFPLVVKVNQGVPPSSGTPSTPTTISNTAQINIPCSATTDPNCANNTATTTQYVASATEADVSITKTASPEPVDQGTNLTYTLQITNNGPAVAQGVTVSDTLPGQVTYASVSTTQGSCTYTASSTLVSCTVGSMSVGALAVVTINVSANTFSSSTLSTNTATVSSTTTDPDSANNSSSATSTIQSPTAVQLISFRAIPRQGGGVLLEWKTREEIRNLGFNIFCLEDGQNRQRLNPSIIAGSALLIRGGRPQHAAKTYQWFDPKGTAQSTYELEDVDLNGTRMAHGPISVDVSAVASSGAISQPLLLTQLNRAITQPAALSRRVLPTPTPVIPVPPPGSVPASLDGDAAVKISVQSEGWYQVSRAQLVAAGLDPFADARNLQLYAEGMEQPMLILGHQTGPLGANDSIEFYGTGIDTPFSGTRVYWLIRGMRPGIRIDTTPAGSTSLSVPQSFPFTVVLQQRTTYFATLLNGENNDNFFGAAVTSEPVDQQLTVANADPNSSMQVSVDVTLQGATDQQAHSVSVAFNGAYIGEMDFANLANVTNTFPIDRSLLVDGVNTVTLTALQGDNDVSVVQTIALHYPHLYAADGNWLKATAPASSTLHVTGFSNQQIQVFDITNPLAISQLSGAIQQEEATYGITLGLQSSAGQERTLLIFSGDQISAPAGLAFHAPAALAARSQGSQMVIITYPDFQSAIGPLVSLHRSRGESVDVVTIDEVFDAFNYGERSPFAMRDFLQNTQSQWSITPQYLLFVGGASLDPRDYLGLGDFDFVPTRMIETAAFKTASDDWFSDFQQTGHATIATGRLPVRSASDAALVVSKIVNFENGLAGGGGNHQALMVADQNVGSDFTSATKFAAADLPSSLQPIEIFADGQDPSTVSQQIIAALNSGPLLVNYSGHGAEEQWSFEDLLDDTSAATLTNGNQLSVYLLMDCLNGFFQDVYATSLAQALMLAPNGGAAAVWASSGFTNQPPQASMNQALLQILKTNPSMPLGIAILQAKTGVSDNDVRRTWILFGDPAMLLQLSPSGTTTWPHRPVRTRPQVSVQH
jgi:uncharacterized repeat protein (TIGR01451 family)